MAQITDLNHVRTYLLLLLIFASCNTGFDEQSDQLPLLFSEPLEVRLNTEDGYPLNQLTGGEAVYVYDARRERVLSGDSIPARGVVVDPSSLQKPKKLRVRRPRTLKQAENNTITDKQFKKMVLDSIIVGAEISPQSPANYVISGTMDTVLTGIPVLAQGKVIPFDWPKPLKAYASIVKYGNGYKVDSYDTEQGLPSSNIDQLIVDDYGVLWFLCDYQLMSYDGEYFKMFSSDNGFAGYDMRCLYRDDSGIIWIGTNGSGLLRFDGEQFQRFELGSKISSVSRIISDKSNTLWLGTNNLGLVRFDGKYRTHYTTNEGFESNVVKPMIVDANNSIWSVVGYTRHLSRFDRKKISTYYHTELNQINDVILDKKGGIWMGTEQFGILSYKDNTFSHLRNSKSNVRYAINRLTLDNNGDLWAGTPHGLYKYSNSQFIQISESDELFVQHLSIGENGEIWVSTAANGLLCYRPNSFQYPIEDTDLRNAVIIRMFEDTQGNTWHGTDGDGVIFYNGTSHVVFDEDHGFPRVVRSIAEDSQGNIWLGSQAEGAFFYNGEHIIQYTKNSGLLHNTVFNIVEDNKGQIWFGTNGGLCMFNDSGFTHFGLNHGLSDLFILDILEDHQGHLWFATWKGGVTKYDGENFFHYTEREGLSNNEVWTVNQDNDNNYWFGTANGLNYFDGETFTYYTKDQGLSDNRISNVLTDASGNLWVASSKGLDFINAGSRDDEKEFIIQLGQNDGLKSERIDGKGLYINSENQLLVGTSQNLAALDLDNFKNDDTSPDVVLHSLEINEREFDYRDTLLEHNDFTYTAVPRFYNYPQGLKLNHNQNHLTFYFAGVDWASQGALHYSYRIKELNRSWSKPSKDAKADYRNLPHGLFTLEIMALGGSGEWGTPFKYQFEIHPPWWLTPWAYLFYGIVTIIAIVGLILWRTFELRKRQKVLELQIKNATEEIREQKDEIEQEKDRSEELLLNILPEAIAEELKEKGAADAKHMESVTVIFTDFKGFTALSENLSPEKLVREINVCFSAFDEIMEKHNVEKIKTIGDAYMAAGGLPTPNETHPLDVVKAALEIQEFMLALSETKKAQNEPFFEVRIGIHTGPVVAGIVGVKKFQYDIWGDTVNTASRMESSGRVGEVNISESTYRMVRDHGGYMFHSRGKIEAKGKGMLEMFFVERNI